MNLLTGSMTPEQFQQYQQEQQQAFFRWQQSQILNRDLDNLQQNPPSFHSESSQTLTQPQQVDSPKKGGRKKTKARRGKNVEDEPQEPVAAGRWLPVEEELLATCYVAVSEDNNVGSKWHTLNANCQKFNAAYKRAKRLGKSGENDVDYLKTGSKYLPGDEQMRGGGSIRSTNADQTVRPGKQTARQEKQNPTQNGEPPVEVGGRPNTGANGAGASSETGSRRKGFRSSSRKRPHTNAVGGVEVSSY
ncbi:hypothetical protein Tco_0935937 [Tanacetum coccineum]